MRDPFILGALVVAALATAGCDDDVRTLTRSSMPTATVTATATATGQDDTPVPTPTDVATPPATMVPETPTNASPTAPASTATPDATATPVGTAPGPLITYFGITTADNRPIASSGTDAAGRAIYERELGTGLNVVIEAANGMDGRPVGTQAFELVGLPDLQVLLSRALGDGSPTVCDIDGPGLSGGVPAVDPPVYSDQQSTVDAINDLGCRVNDGTGVPAARTSNESACTRFETGEFGFVNSLSRVQFCLPIARAWAFPQGDTIVTARVRSAFGSLGNPQQIVVRIARALTPLPTLPPQTPQTPSPTRTPVPPEITYFGIAAADDAVIAASEVDGEGRNVYSRLIGHAFSLIIEAAPVTAGRPVGPNAFSPEGLTPDLQLLLSRDVGDGNPEVCDVDIENGIFGGVPGTDPLEFDGGPEVIDAMNDLGCRVNDGTGAPVGRTNLSPCTRDPFGNFTFVDPRSTIQFCLPIARAWQFQTGDTIAAARVRSIDGALSAVEEMVVRVEGDGREECETGGPGARVFSIADPDSSLMTAGVSGDQSSEWLAEPALLCAGPDDEGVHPLRLLADFTAGLRVSDGSVLCMAFSAAGSSGFLDCAGGEPNGVRYQIDAADDEVELLDGLGEGQGPGGAMLTLPVAFRTLGASAEPQDCLTAIFPEAETVTLTTGTGEAEVINPQQGGTVAIAVDGEAFDCNQWRSEGSAGTWVLPLATTIDTPIGDTASVFSLAD